MQNLITLIFSSKQEKKLSDAHVHYVKEIKALTEKRGDPIVGVSTAKRQTRNGDKGYYSLFYCDNGSANPILTVWTTINKKGQIGHGHC